MSLPSLILAVIVGLSDSKFKVEKLCVIKLFSWRLRVAWRETRSKSNVRLKTGAQPAALQELNLILRDFGGLMRSLGCNMQRRCISLKEYIGNQNTIKYFTIKKTGGSDEKNNRHPPKKEREPDSVSNKISKSITGNHNDLFIYFSKKNH